MEQPIRFAAFAAGVALPTLPAWGTHVTRTVGVWPLFWKSFDLFTVVLLVGSVAAVAIIVRCVMEIRAGRILPRGRVEALREAIDARNWKELKAMVDRDPSFPGRVLHAALAGDSGSRTAFREAAELAASEENAGWFRRIEPLNVIGNLGPLVGLAGTVWGMILAFTQLGEAGGQASASDLSLGISKALFHTLLGLCLAIPCLLTYGFYRTLLDRVCTRALSESSELVERIVRLRQQETRGKEDA